MIFKKSRNECVKDKLVKFELDKEMKMPDLLKKGYRRNEIVTLFELLESQNFGVYTKGKRGRNSPTMFLANDRCPDVYEITFKVYRLRKNKKEGEVEDVVDQSSDHISFIIANVIPKLKIQSCPMNRKGGYSLGVFEDKIFLVRSLDGGFETIEQAVKFSWDLFNGKIEIFKSKIMSDVEQVASTLRGLGFVQLESS